MLKLDLVGQVLLAVVLAFVAGLYVGRGQWPEVTGAVGVFALVFGAIAWQVRRQPRP